MSSLLLVWWNRESTPDCDARSIGYSLSSALRGKAFFPGGAGFHNFASYYKFLIAEAVSNQHSWEVRTFLCPDSTVERKPHWVLGDFFPSSWRHGSTPGEANCENLIFLPPPSWRRTFLVKVLSVKVALETNLTSSLHSDLEPWLRDFFLGREDKLATKQTALHLFLKNFLFLTRLKKNQI